MMERFNTDGVAFLVANELIHPSLKQSVFKLCAAYDELWREHAETQRKLGEIEATRQAAIEPIPAKRKRG